MRRDKHEIIIVKCLIYGVLHNTAFFFTPDGMLPFPKNAERFRKQEYISPKMYIFPENGGNLGNYLPTAE
jgi:hypothetical protein